MTNAPKPEQDLTHNEHSFDGITFEVVEEEAGRTKVSAAFCLT